MTGRIDSKAQQAFCKKQFEKIASQLKSDKERVKTYFLHLEDHCSELALMMELATMPAFNKHYLIPCYMAQCKLQSDLMDASKGLANQVLLGIEAAELFFCDENVDFSSVVVMTSMYHKAKLYCILTKAFDLAMQTKKDKFDAIPSKKTGMQIMCNSKVRHSSPCKYCDSSSVIA